MSISFNQVPSNLRIPIFAVEFNSSNAVQGGADLNYRALLIGQKITAGTQAANTLAQVFSADDVATRAGRGSMLHRQAKRWFKVNQGTELWVGVLADDGSSVAATGTIAFTGPATAAGTIYLYVCGDLIPVAVASGDTATTVATNAAAAVNAITDLPCTAAAATGTVTFTARNKGICGNGIDFRLNYNAGNTLPAGIAATVTAMANGAVNPVLTSLIAAMGDTWFNIIAHGYTDATSLTALETELASRAGPTRMIDGFAITAANDTLSNLATLGNGRNSQFSTIFATQNSPKPPLEIAAQAAAVIAMAGNDDPARPFQTLALPDVPPPAVSDQHTAAQRNTLAYAGISSLKAVAGITVIDTTITTYKTNAAGAPDTSYLQLNTGLTLMYLRYSLRAAFQTKYPRHKLGDDGNAFGAGQAVLTPSIAKAEVINWFNDMMDKALVENEEAFAQNLVIERDATNRQRLNFLLPPELVSQFIVGAVSMQFTT